MPGRYTLIRQIGRGGMAEIWKAKATGPSGFQKFFAVKMILPDIAEDRVFAPMFVDEAKLEASLAHPNLIHVFDFGDDDGLFLAMEYVPGGNVDRLLSRLHKAGETLPIEVAIYIAREVARGLAHAHAKGIVHRDVSPQNILATPTGDVKLGDFGIAKAASVIPRTAAGHVRGKLAYMSPEHLGSRKLDGRSDLFSLGVVLYEMSTGARLFGGKSGDEISEQVKKFDPMADLDLSKVPEQVADVLVVLLQQDPADRYSDASQLEEELGKRLGVGGIAKAQKDLAALVQRLFSAELLADAKDEAGEEPAPSTIDREAETKVTPGPRNPPTAPKPKRSVLPLVLGASAIVLGAAGFGWWKLHGTPVAEHRGGTLHLAIGFPAEDYDIFSIEWSRSRIAMNLVVEPFLKIGRDGEAMPWAIERSEIHDKTITLHVRSGMMFHEHPCLHGKPREATGADVAFSIREAVRANALALPIRGADAFRAGDAKALGLEETADGAKLELTDPVPFYETQLADIRLVPHELDGCEDVRHMRQPVGTGPFRFDGPQPGPHISLVRAHDYWHRAADGTQLPLLDGIAIEPVDDLPAALSRLGRGEIDLLMPINDDWPKLFDRKDELLEIKERYRGLGVDLVGYTSNSRIALLGIIIGAKESALSDRRVRGALARALDRKALVAASDRPIAGPSGRFLDSRMLGYDAKLPELGLDLDGARKLLAEANHPDGAGLKPITIGTLRDQAVGAELAKQASVIGLPVTIVTLPPASAQESLASGQVDAIIVQNIWRLRGGENADLVPEVARFARPSRLAKLHVDLLSTPERSARTPIYRQIEEALLDELPTIPIAWGDQHTPYEVYVVGKRVRNFHDPITTYGRLDDIEHAWLGAK